MHAINGRLFVGGYSASSWHLLLHNGIDSASHTGEQLCQKLVSNPMWQQMLSAKCGGHPGMSPLSLQGSADALGSEGMRRVIHPGLVSDLGKPWKPSAPLFC